MIQTLILILSFLCAWPLLAEDKEGGIIGTGVIGQITGLDQFEVSGMGFGFAPDMELKGLSAVDELRMGMTLALSTGRDGATWQIQTLQHIPLLTGPVTGPGEVMGIPVVGALPASGMVQVDGFWSEAAIIATRITEPTKQIAQVSGVYDGFDRIGGLPVQGLARLNLTAGQRVIVIGQFVDGVFTAETSMQSPFTDATPDLVLLEGFFEPTPQGDTFSLQGVAVANVDTERDVGLDALVRRCALHGRIDFVRDELTSAEQELVESFCVSASN